MKEDFNWELRKTKELVNYYSEHFKPNGLEPALLQYDWLIKESPEAQKNLKKH